MTWVERQLERLRGLPQLVVDGALAAILLVLAVGTVYSQEIRDGLSEPGAWSLLPILVVSAPVAFRRRDPLLALAIGSAGIFLQIVADWPEGSLPMTVLLLTYTVGAWEGPRRAGIGLGVIYATLILLGVTDTPGLDTVGVIANLAIFTVAWLVGVALRARRDATDARVRAADERAAAERAAAARALAEERLRIAQELHDVVAHSMSVIAVQAGVGAHVLDTRPDEARVALDAISATSRGTLSELRRLLGALRDADGERAHAPAPGLADLQALVDDVRAAGVPVVLSVEGTPSEAANPGVELSAYRIVQEALTNVIKHAGAPSRVEVSVRHLDDAVAVEVVDDGRGAAVPAGGVPALGGHGHVGMRERVEVWGGTLSVGPVPGGGFGVAAVLPYGDA